MFLVFLVSGTSHLEPLLAVHIKATSHYIQVTMVHKQCLQILTKNSLDE